MQAPYLDVVQGVSEEWTKLYSTYSEGAPQQSTKQYAKSFGRAGGSAGKQAKAIRSLQ